jgi:hypothetical protein
MTTHTFLLRVEADPDTSPHDLSYFVINELESSMEADGNPGISFVEIDDGTTSGNLVAALEDILPYVTGSMRSTTDPLVARARLAIEAATPDLAEDLDSEMYPRDTREEDERDAFNTRLEAHNREK